jgi:hypothetical protein
MDLNAFARRAFRRPHAAGSRRYCRSDRVGGTGAVPQTNLRGRLCPSYADGTLTGRAALLLQYQPEENDMGRGLLLWLIGIPLPIILIVWLLGGLHG